jgi:hypothetical protein
VVESESAMWISFCAITVNDCGGNYVGVIWVSAADGDGFAKKVNIPIAIAGICAVSNKNRIAIIGIINSGLNVIEIRGFIVIYGDYFRLTGNG